MKEEITIEEKMIASSQNPLQRAQNKGVLEQKTYKGAFRGISRPQRYRVGAFRRGLLFSQNHLCKTIALTLVFAMLFTGLMVTLSHVRGEEYLSEWTNTYGVEENTTIFATTAGAPSLEFYMDESYVKKATDTMTSSGTIQFDCYVMMGGHNTLAIAFLKVGPPSDAFYIYLYKNETIILGESRMTETLEEISSETEYNITHGVALNQWMHIGITRNQDKFNVTVGTDKFSKTIRKFDVDKLAINVTGPAVSGILSKSVFVDNVDLQYKASWLEIAGGWYDVVVGSEYFPLVYVLIVVGVIIAIIEKFRKVR